MRNILSLKPGTPILGKEIRNWFNYHSENETSHSKIARGMKKRFENLRDERYYKIFLVWETAGCGDMVHHKPLIRKSQFVGPVN